MLEDVTARLASFGYEVTGGDSWGLDFIIQKVENSIKADCNIDSIPDGLHEIAVDMVVGEFLLNKKSKGQLEGFNLETAIKQVQAGDTNVTFSIGEGSSSPEQRLDSLLAHLINSGRGDFACYRKIRW